MKRTILAISILSCLAACSREPEIPQYQAAPTVVAAPAATTAVQPAAAPVIINQAPAAAPHSGVGDMLMGGALGYMLGSAGSRGGNGGGGDTHHSTVNRTTVIKKTVIVQAAPAKPAKTYAPARPSPTYRSSYSSARSGGRR